MPNINHEILIWARESNCLTLNEAAQKLQIKDTKTKSAEDKLLAYENGEVAPSRSLLKRMAHVYRKSLLTFYMETTPKEAEKTEDFRTLPEGFTPKEDVYVNALISDIRARQSVLRDTIIDEDEAQIIPFIGTATLQENPFELASVINENLGFSLEEFRKYKKIDDSFKYLRAVVENTGIFVLLAGNLGSHHSNIDTEIFRGFALADDIAPFIVINDQDAKSACSFTLLHEIVHLWLGQTGVSGDSIENRIEQFCNAVASEILLPHNDLETFKPDFSNFDGLAQEITIFSEARNISSSHVSYRLLRSKIIDKDTWLKLSKFYKQQWINFKNATKEKNREKQGGPNYFVVRRNKLGNALVNFTERMTSSGALTPTKAGLILGVKPLKVHKLFETGRAT